MTHKELLNFKLNEDTMTYKELWMQLARLSNNVVHDLGLYDEMDEGSHSSIVRTLQTTSLQTILSSIKKCHKEFDKQ